MNFTGSPNAYIQVSNLVHLPTVSLSLWFRAEGDGGILNRDPMFSSNDTFYGLDISAGALRWRVGGETVIETEPGAIQNGMIYHAVITHLDEDGFGNDTAMQSRLFLNGVMIGEVTDPIGYDTYDNVEGTNNRRLWIGTKSGGNGYGGQIDDIQVYDVELTPTEAVELFTTPGSAARVENPNLATTSGGIFGTPPPNTGLQERALAITNTGESETLTIASAIVTGTSKDRFTIGDVPAELAPGATAFVPVTLDPAGQDGTFTAQIEFETNDEGGATVIVDLTTRVEKESGLLTHFKMDETQGTAMIDSSGNEFHGEYKTTDGGSFTLGAPGLADGTAVRLNDAGGSGAAFGELAKDAGLPSLSSLTISMWVKFDPSESGGIAVLFSKGEIVGNPFSVVLGVTDAANPFQWFAGEEEAITTSPVLEIDQVHHVVISHLDSNGPDEGADKTTIYVDNVIAGESTPSVGFDDNRSSLLQIGAFIGTIGLNGTVDDFQLYARAYEAEDVAFLFENPGQVIGVKTVPPAATVPILSDVSFSGDSFSLSVSGETPADIEYSENLENWEV
ncbi:MAG: LamG-like jellyroll fold domain-containing protein, partial [Verrucomicrobiales bacterium]